MVRSMIKPLITIYLFILDFTQIVNYFVHCSVLLLRTFRFNGFSLLDKATKITAINFIQVSLGECAKI